MANKLIVVLADKAGNRVLGQGCFVSVNLTPCDRRAPPQTIETMNIVNILPSSIIINIDPKYITALHDAITGFPVYVNGPRRLAISQHNWNEMHVLYIEAKHVNIAVCILLETFTQFDEQLEKDIFDFVIQQTILHRQDWPYEADANLLRLVLNIIDLADHF
ncbi:unnamed protein product [Rotaria sp. Silwood2]|nr:unnamed protein product [Rotaria sp. Silwood2]